MVTIPEPPITDFIILSVIGQLFFVYLYRNFNQTLFDIADDVPSENEAIATMDKMQLTVAFNYSDTTFGWKGPYKNALTLYYLHSSSDIGEEKHSYPAVPGLTPIMNLLNIHTSRLGPPFSKCIRDKHYTAQACVYKKMLKKIIQVCECYPPYATQDIDALCYGRDDMDARDELCDLSQKEFLKPCDFYTHATCVTLIKVTLMSYNKGAASWKNEILK